MLTRLQNAAFGVILLSLSITQARAGLIGDSVTVDVITGATKDTVFANLGTATVTGAGAIFGSTFNIGVFDTAVTVTNTTSGTVAFAPATFNGWRITNVTGSPAITGLTINAATTQAGFDASRISFDATHIYVNMVGLTTQPGLDVKLDVQFVPEPATFAFVGLALGAFVFLRRRTQISN